MALKIEQGGITRCKSIAFPHGHKKNPAARNSTAGFFPKRIYGRTTTFARSGFFAMSFLRPSSRALFT
jgi:hypothetical protein